MAPVPSSRAGSIWLDAGDLALLQGARLVQRRSVAGRIHGERLVRRKGTSIEFADYREYAEGDDLRHLDWNVLARLGQAVMRTYQDEEDLAVHLCLDASPSMQFGTPTKWHAALRFAAGLGFTALGGQDALYGHVLGTRQRQAAPLRGQASFGRLCTWLSGLRPPTTVERGLAGALRQLAHSSSRPGLALVLSDGLDPELPSALHTLHGRGHEVNVLIVLSPEELDPDLEGDLRLVDAETGAAVEITANADALKAYRQRLDTHLQAVEAACTRGGGRFALVRQDTPFREVVREVFWRKGWIAS